MQKLTIALALTTSILAISPVAAEQTKPAMRIISMVGHGVVKSAPDMATVTVGVVREARTAREALSANNAAMREVIDTLKAAGIAEKDIQTSNFSVQPKYIYPKQSSTGERQPPRIVGYTVSNNVTIAVRKLDALGPVLDSVISVGSNQVNGISFSIAEPKPLQNEARKRATADAIAKAQLYAEAAGVTLGPIQSISERGSPRPPRPYLRQAANVSMAAAEAVPVAQGEQAVKMQVYITWEIK
ncbi:MAG: SIMPL domain-containing protein [Rhizobiales bacterium]|nr:SIMPL domain-containing protein [Hyphomicrobiales bacterium]